jgi:diphosphomevalonate decarboxylase
MKDEVVTAIASPNIAFVKYWGKRNPENLNLPNNTSISMTLDNQALKTKTSVVLSEEFGEDIVYVNGVKQVKGSSEKSGFMFNVIKEMKGISGVNKNVLVVSKNYFPTGSGLASSASGAAALVYALNSAFNAGLTQRQMSIMARKISGSACRSIFGGYVIWKKGEMEDGSDSYAEQIATKSDFDLVDLICLVNENQKKISSSAGHSLTVKTSALYKARPKYAEENALSAINAIKNKDFAALSEIIIRDSNNMHATMLDTFPPIRYMTDKSWDVVEAVNELNKNGSAIAAYTFDAGPNAHVIVEKKNAEEVKNRLLELFEPEKIIYAGTGEGPYIAKDEGHLIDQKLNPVE